MNIAEIIKPRYKVIADYPNSGYEIGTIKLCAESEHGDVNYYKKYPAIFRRLEWWEDREIKTLPVYIRFGEFDDRHTIYKINYFTDKEAELYSDYMPCGFAENMIEYLVSLKFPNSLPATEEEYELFMASKIKI